MDLAPVPNAPAALLPGGPGPLAPLARLALWLAMLALLGMAAVQAWQVFARYVLNASPGWTEPLALLLMNTAMMCGAAVGVRAGRHFAFTLLLDALPGAWRRAVDLLVAAIVGGIGVALALGGVRLLLDDWPVQMAGAALPEGLRYLPLCLGGALLALFALERLVWLQPATPAASVPEA